ncbi:MAG: redoxin domain-containing protein [Chloroflexi bacterium]|nr:redoxin domain-containing protein [Chloroflexota bacterium]
MLRDFSSGHWLNSPPLSFAQLRGRVVLLSFWSSASPASLRALPTLQRWHERYAAAGLTVIGVHTPEFAFGREQTQIEWALTEFPIPYPVLLDNDSALWNAYANEDWPAFVLLDANGQARAQTMFAGRDLEQSLQRLLLNREPNLELPSLRPDDPLPEGFLQPTPDLFAGYHGGSLGNAEGYAGVAPMLYPMTEQRRSGAFYVSGAWQASPEYLTYRGTTEGILQLPYEATEVSAVLSPHPDAVERMLHPEPLSVEIWQDDLPIPNEQRGADVTEDGRLLLDRPRLYDLVRNPAFERHELTLRIHTRGFTLYKFSFVGGLRRKALER